MDKFYKTTKISEETIKFTITVPKEAFTKSYKELLKREASKSTVPGFRKGSVPMELFEPKVKEAVMLDTFDRIAPIYLSASLSQEQMEPIAPPKYTNLPKLALDQDIVFDVEITIMPQFKLVDVKDIKIKQEKIEATEKEVQDTLETIQKENKTEATEINDVWAKEIADKYKIEEVKDLATLKEQVISMLKQQKETLQRKNDEQEVLKQMIEKSKIQIPQSAVDYESAEREHSFLHDVKEINLTPEEFCKRNGVTMEQLKAAWKKDSKEALETDTVLKLYAQEKGLEVTEEDMKKQIDIAKQRAKAGTDEKVYENPQWLEYIRNYVLKQKAYVDLVTSVIGEFKPAEASSEPAKGKIKSKSKKK